MRVWIPRRTTTGEFERGGLITALVNTQTGGRLQLKKREYDVAIVLTVPGPQGGFHTECLMWGDREYATEKWMEMILEMAINGCFMVRPDLFEEEED